MKYQTVQEKVTAIHTWVARQRENTKSDSTSPKSDQHKAMMAGKRKAYADVLCFLKGRFNKYLIPPASKD